MSDWFEKLIAPSDVSCFVGQIKKVGLDIPLAFFLADHGKDVPTFSDVMMRYKRMSIDIVPEESGDYNFIVMGDKVVAEVTTESLDRALALPPGRDVFAELVKGGTPEFSIACSLGGESREYFESARGALGGLWLLVLLAEDATELLVNERGIIIERNVRPREVYEESLEQ